MACCSPKVCTLLCSALVIFSFAHGSNKSLSLSQRMQEAAEKWEDFKIAHNKTYKNRAVELLHRRIFINNQIIIDQHNRLARLGHRTFEMKANHMADVPPAELRQLDGFLETQEKRPGWGAFSSPERYFEAPNNTYVPYHVDWRWRNVISRVKTQGHCASCYAFAAIAALEAHYAMKTGRIVTFSEQNLMDCSHEFGNSGCKGGNIHTSFEYVINNPGINTEASYPYEERNNSIGTHQQSYVRIREGNEEDLKVAVATLGPVAVCFHGGLSSFRYYYRGVYYDPACYDRQNSHCVLIVGYGSEWPGGDYWIVKNSWTEDFGDNGYIKMARNRKNHCNIASRAYVPIL